LSDEFVVEQLIRADCARGFKIPIAQCVVTDILRRVVMVQVLTPGSPVTATEAAEEPASDSDAAAAGDGGNGVDGVDAGERDSASSSVAESKDAAAAAGRMERRVLISANVTAVLESHFPPSADDEDIAAALEVQQLSADKGVQLLSEVGIAYQRQPRRLHHM